jgi:hypothetical protein
MAAFLIHHERSSRQSQPLQRFVDRLARHKRKISLAAINSLPGKNCLVAAIRRWIIAKLAAHNDKIRKHERKRKLCRRATRQDLAAKRSRPTTGALRVV